MFNVKGNWCFLDQAMCHHALGFTHEKWRWLKEYLLLCWFFFSKIFNLGHPVLFFLIEPMFQEHPLFMGQIKLFQNVIIRAIIFLTAMARTIVVAVLSLLNTFKLSKYFNLEAVWELTLLQYSIYCIKCCNCFNLGFQFNNNITIV